MDDKFNELFNNAYNLHTSGKLDEAKAEYENILKLYPGNADVNYMLAQLYFTTENYDDSLKLFGELYEKLKNNDIALNIMKIYLMKKDYENVISFSDNIKDKTPEILRTRANTFLRTGKFKEAVEEFLKPVLFNSADGYDIFNLSISYMNLGDNENALKYALILYENNKKDTDLLIHIAGIYNNLNDIDNQLKFLIEASNIITSANILYNIAILLIKKGEDEAALEYLKKVVKIQPDNLNAYFNIGRILEKYNKNNALELYIDLNDKFPSNKQLLFKTYSTATELENYQISLECAKELSKLSPDDKEMKIFLANAYYNVGKYEDALKEYKEVQKNYTGNFNFNIHLSKIYSLLNMQKELYEIINNLDEEEKKSFTYAESLLRNKDFEAAREGLFLHLAEVEEDINEIEKEAAVLFYKYGYDKRFNINEKALKEAKPSTINKTMERSKYYVTGNFFNENPDNKRILVYNNDGAGDIIMFSRYIKTLEKHTKNIVLTVQKPLYRLIKENFPEYEVRIDDKVSYFTDFDYSVSWFGLLPVLKENTLENIPFSSGYLTVNENLVNEKKALDIMQTKKKKVGLFWQGNPNTMPQRSIKLKKLEPLKELQNIQFYSFQMSTVDYDSELLKKDFGLIDLKPYINDYLDTAAFLKNMDVLVSIDTSVTNLAGAIGVKTFLMLPFKSEWRWFYDTDKTPWYDSVKIFKQKIPYEWGDVVERIKKELEAL